MHAFFIIVGLSFMFSAIGISGSLRRIAVALEVLTTHNLKFPPPEADEAPDEQ